MIVCGTGQNCGQTTFTRVGQTANARFFSVFLVFSRYFEEWIGQRPLAPKAGALPTALHPEKILNLCRTMNIRLKKSLLCPPCLRYSKFQACTKAREILTATPTHTRFICRMAALVLVAQSRRATNCATSRKIFCE